MSSWNCVLYFLLVFCVFQTHGFKFKFQRKNVCRSFSGYLFDINNDCYHSDDILASLTDIVERHFGHYEKFQITTEDGYILEVFRIRRENPKGVIILQHPVTADATLWVEQGNQSLAYLFYQKGFDVWLPNNRGTPFSTRHVNISSYDPKFWDYSFHEIGLYDYSAIISFIKDTTKSSKIIYLGHSMSTTSSMVYASMKPEEAKNAVKLFINLSPVGYIKHAGPGPAILFGFAVPILEVLRKSFGVGAISGNRIIADIMQRFIVWFPIKQIVNYVLSAILGWTPSQMAPEMINVCPNGAFKTCAIKIFSHYSQIYNGDGDFRMWNYGKTKNMKLYGSQVPPEYPLGDIQVPFYLFWGDRDPFAFSTKLTYDKMSKTAKRFGYRYLHNTNHIDTLFGKNRYKEVYSYMLAAIDEVLK